MSSEIIKINKFCHARRLAKIRAPTTPRTLTRCQDVGIDGAFISDLLARYVGSPQPKNDSNVLSFQWLYSILQWLNSNWLSRLSASGWAGTNESMINRNAISLTRQFYRFFQYDRLMMANNIVNAVSNNEISNK